MNKKILSIFALIMAISILGVSCAKDNSTTNPVTPPTPPISADDAKKVVNAMNTVTAGTANFDLSAVDVTASSADYKVSVTDNAASASVEIKDLIAAIAGKKGAMESAVSGVTITDTDISYTIADNEETATVTIPYTKDDKKANFIITFDLKDNNKFVLTDVAIANIKAKFNALGVVDSAGTQDAAANDNVDFTSANIASGKMALTAKDKTSSGDSKIDLVLIDKVVEKINGISGLTGITTIVAESKGDPTAANPANITVTLTLDKGYKFADDVTTAGVTDGIFTVEITPESTKNWGTRE